MAYVINPKSDVEIQRDVLRELGWDTRVGAAEVGVQVEAGVVALTGAVASWARKLAAQEAAHRVTGVLDVVNDLDVVPSARARAPISTSRTRSAARSSGTSTLRTSGSPRPSRTAS